MDIPLDTADEVWKELCVHHAYLYKVALRLTPDEHLAQDVVQDTLLTAYQKFSQFQARSSLRTWLTSILKNRLREIWRSNQRWIAPAIKGEDSLDDFDVLFAQDGHWSKDEFVFWKSPEYILSEKQFLLVFDECLQRLPNQTGQVFIMSQVLEMTTDEILLELRIKPSNLRVLLFRARMTLKLCLEKNWLEIAV